jgi:glutamyl-tRNA synthetase
LCALNDRRIEEAVIRFAALLSSRSLYTGPRVRTDVSLESARKFALQNAVLHGGKADPKAVLGRLIAEDPSLRERAREAAAAVERVVAEVNRLAHEAQRAELGATAPELLEKAPVDVGPKELPPLPSAVDGQVVLRLAPYPSGPLHIGNARAFLLNDAYAKRYHGRLLLVFDDTIGSEEKPLLPEAFDQVREGLDWAGVEYRDVVYKSDRIPLHYEWAEKLIATGEAYVDECDAETLRKNREAGKACVHRIQGADETIAMWKAMLDGEYREGEAVVRLKTDMAHPNPAFRDRVLFRITEREHPRVGTRYRVWPMLEFSWAVDDALLGITHVLRGKDLVMEDLMEARIWDVLGIERRPEFVHFGILRFKDLELSKSRYRREIAAGRLSGIDDPRTWSLQSLRRRGIQPAALRTFVLSFGLSLADIEVPAETLYAENRKLIDKDANRYFFVPDPVSIEILGLPPVRVVRAPLHPDFPGRGQREIPVEGKIQVAREDLERFRGKEVRLKDFCNVVLDQRARFVSMENKDIPKIQWVDHGVPAHLVMPDGSTSKGPAEPAVASLKVDDLVQFERVGFARIDHVSKAEVRAHFAHR